MTPLALRLDAVCQARGWTDREWSRRARKSDGFVGTHRHRAANPSYVLPEDAASVLAAAAGVRARWLRFGEGPMEGVDAEDAVRAAVRETPRQALVSALAAAIPALSAAGDAEAAQIAARALHELLDDEVSHTRPRVTAVHKT